MIEIRGRRRRGPPRGPPKNIFAPGATKRKKKTVPNPIVREVPMPTKKKKKTVPVPTAPKNISGPSAKKGKYVPAYGSKSTTLSRNRFRGGEGYNAEINEEQCLWKIDGFEINEHKTSCRIIDIKINE